MVQLLILGLLSILWVVTIGTTLPVYVTSPFMLIQAFGFVRSAIGTLKMLPKGINNYHQPHNLIKFLNSFKLIKKTLTTVLIGSR
jgi:hypothetical protein